MEMLLQYNIDKAYLGDFEHFVGGEDDGVEGMD